MGNTLVLLMSLIVFLPALGAICLMFIPKERVDLLRWFTLAITAAVFVLTVWVFLVPGYQGGFEYRSEAAAYMQHVFSVPWIPAFDIDYFMGVDGISFPLIMLTALVSLLAMGASWSVTKAVKGYCVLFLLLETGMLGVFLSLDFFLFYVFWEVMLLPMYFLIGVWGGPRREYAAIKFFLYTLVGSVLMLIAILMLYFSSDVRQLAQVQVQAAGSPRPVRWQALHLGPGVERKIGRGQLLLDQPDGSRSAVVFLRAEQHAGAPLEIRFEKGTSEEPAATYDAAAGRVTLALMGDRNTAADVVAAIQANAEVRQQVLAAIEGDGSVRVPVEESRVELPAFDPARKVHTFNILALSAMGQHTSLFDRKLAGASLQWWAFLLLFIGFLIKVPGVPLHTWLPDAHVEAPTPISMILAGVLLKMGGYGIIRICYPICPHGGYELAWVVCLLGVISMVYGGFAALAQKDFKRLVAYSSVSHMGYVVLGLGVWSATAGTVYSPYFWNMGVQGAMFQMIAHGISSAGMFFLVGVIYDRVHHRNLNEFGGLFGKMPVYTALSIGIFFAALGLPGLCGFIGEFLVVLSVWTYSQVLAIIAASVVILTASYILWAVQRVYLGAEYRGPHEEALVPSNLRENTIAGVLFVLAILFGVFPHTCLLRYMEKTIDRQVEDLTAWTRYVKEAPAQAGQPAGAVSAVRSTHNGPDGAAAGRLESHPNSPAEVPRPATPPDRAAQARAAQADHALVAQHREDKFLP